MARPKKLPNPDAPEHEYLIKHIPMDVWLKAQTKAVQERTTMAEVLRALIRAWVEA